MLHVGGKSSKATVGFASEFEGMLQDVPRRAAFDNEQPAQQS